MNYRSTDEALCPGKLASATSNTSSIKGVFYEYDDVSSFPTCLLKRVHYQILDDPNSTEPAWDFAYRYADGQAYLGGAGGSGEDDAAFGYLPLHIVRTPTGAKVRYSYDSMGTCEYQTVEPGDAGCLSYLGTDGQIASGRNGPRRPVVSTRTVFDSIQPINLNPDAENSDITASGQVTNFSYSSQSLTNYTVDRSISYQLPDSAGDLVHTMTFGRVVKDVAPVGFLFPSINESDQPQRWLNSGRLLTHQISSPNTEPVVVEYRYREANGTDGGGDSFLAFLDIPWEEDNTFTNNNKQYLYSQRRINLHRQITIQDDVTYEIQNQSFDMYNGVGRKLEMYSVNGGASEQRLTVYDYDNAHQGKNVWFVGAMKSSKMETGTPANAEPIVNRYVYNTDGLLAVQFKTGFLTSYTYHNMGNIKEESTSSGNTTIYSNYKNGVARSVVNAESEETLRNVDAFGNVVREIDPRQVVVSYEYNDRYRRLTSIKQDGIVADSIIANPVWLNAGALDDYRKKREIQGNFLRTTTFDYQGRVLSVTEQDVSDASTGRKTRYEYDVLGRLTFQSDPHPINASGISGTTFTYDGFGRLLTQKHSADASAVEFCYRQACAAQAKFSVPGNEKLVNGYVVKDLAGYVSLYNYRAFGTPANKELVEISQQKSGIEEGSSVEAVVTDIARNKAGFITKVTQRSSIPGSVPQRFREYVAHERGYAFSNDAFEVSSTLLVESESMSELFGVARTVTTFDDVGNPKVVIGYDGEETEYVYDKAYRLRFQLNKAAGTNDIQYQYYPNGLIKSVQHAGSTWNYTYNVNNNLASESLSIDGLPEPFSIGYTYDALQNVNVMTYPSGRVLDYNHNALGQPVSVGGYVSNAKYHPSGMISEIDFENGQKFRSQEDAKDRPWSWRQYIEAGAQFNDIINYTYSYDARSNVEGIENYFKGHAIAADGVASSSSLTGLRYDGLSRLLSATGSWNADNSASSYGIRYNYNVFGDITTRFEGSDSYSYSYRDGGLLDKVANNSQAGDIREFKYDRDFDPTGQGNGNITRNGRFALEYNQMNQLVQVPAEEGRRGQENLYDGNMMRVKSIITEIDEFENATVAAANYHIYAQSGLLLHESPIGPGETKDHIYFDGKRIATRARHNNIDTDADGIPDYFERLHGLNSNDPDDAILDTDGDGLNNLFEFENGLLPGNTDSDFDGIPDGEDPDTPIPSGTIVLVEGLETPDSEVTLNSTLSITFTLAETSGFDTEIDGLELWILDANGLAIEEAESPNLPAGVVELDGAEERVISADVFVGGDTFSPGSYQLELRYIKDAEAFAFAPPTNQSNPLPFSVLAAPEGNISLNSGLLLSSAEVSIGEQLTMSFALAELSGNEATLDGIELWLLDFSGDDVAQLFSDELPEGEFVIEPEGYEEFSLDFFIDALVFEPGNYQLELRFVKNGILSAFEVVGNTVNPVDLTVLAQAEGSISLFSGLDVFPSTVRAGQTITIDFSLVEVLGNSASLEGLRLLLLNADDGGLIQPVTTSDLPSGTFFMDAEGFEEFSVDIEIDDLVTEAGNYLFELVFIKNEVSEPFNALSGQLNPAGFMLADSNQMVRIEPIINFFLD